MTTGPEEAQPAIFPDDPSQLAEIPISYQGVSEHFQRRGTAQPFALRRETMIRIERITSRPLLCYIAKTRNLSAGIPAYIDDGDLTGFNDLVHSVMGSEVDVFIVSNGGSAEATERIVRLLRDRFRQVRFIVPANAYSAATLACLSGDEILMDAQATLGPIDPQMDGVPARAILRAFERLEARLKEEGPAALTAYMPLLAKYDLHLLELCRSAQELSEELARTWLATYMLRCPETDGRIQKAVAFLSDYDLHKSHGRSIGREKAAELGLRVRRLEDYAGLVPLVRSLYSQYELWFDKTSFYKMFENAHGINWGRQTQSITLQLPVALPGGMPPLPVPQPGPPERSG